MKRIIVFALAALVISVSACQRNTGITEPSTYSTPVTMTEVERTQVWIDRIDPFVTQNPDQTWNLDSDSFYQQYAPRGNDAVTVTNLMGGIGMSNQEILKDRKGISPESITHRWHWWGQSWTFTGVDARHAINNMQLGALIPPFTFTLTLSATLAQRYYDDNGGFSICKNWFDGYWIGRPF